MSSEVSGVEEAESEVEPHPPFRMPGVTTLRVAFLLLDQVNLADEMKERASAMKSVPKFLQGSYRITIRTALEEICGGHRSQGGSSGKRLEAFLPSPKNVVAPASKRGPHSTIEIGEQV